MKIYRYQKGLQGQSMGKFEFYTSVYVKIMVQYVVTLYNVTDHVNVWTGTWWVCLHDVIACNYFKSSIYALVSNTVPSIQVRVFNSVHILPIHFPYFLKAQD